MRVPDGPVEPAATAQARSEVKDACVHGPVTVVLPDGLYIEPGPWTVTALLERLGGLEGYVGATADGVRRETRIQVEAMSAAAEELKRWLARDAGEKGEGTPWRRR